MDNIDWLIEKYGNIIQVATPNRQINPYVGGTFIIIKAPRDELVEIQTIMGWGAIMHNNRDDTYRWELSTEKDGRKVKAFAHELMRRFEARERYGNFYVYEVGRRFWYDVFGAPK